MAIFRNEDITAMLVDWENTLTFDSNEFPCALDDGDEEVLEQNGGGGQLVRRIKATVRTSDVAGLEPNGAVSIDGIDYIVWEKRKLDDGGVTELWLRLA